MTRIPTSITILIDSREKYPLLFPARFIHRGPEGKPRFVTVATRTVALPCGDYALEGHDRCLIERKGSVRELSSNLLGPLSEQRRALASLTRTAQVPRRILLLDIPLADWFHQTPTVAAPEAVLTQLLATTSRLGYELLSMGPCKTTVTRRWLGEFVARLLLEDYLHAQVSPSPDPARSPLPPDPAGRPLPPGPPDAGGAAGPPPQPASGPVDGAAPGPRRSKGAGPRPVHPRKQCKAPGRRGPKPGDTP